MANPKSAEMTRAWEIVALSSFTAAIARQRAAHKACDRGGPITSGRVVAWFSLLVGGLVFSCDWRGGQNFHGKSAASI